MSRLFYTGDSKTIDWQDLPGISPISLSYDDVLLIPQSSDITSRSEVDTSVRFGPYTLQIPIISAPMDTISGEVMIRELARLGAMGSLPRSRPEEFSENLAICERLTSDNIPCLYAVGLKNGLEQAGQLKDRGATFILVDVANGEMLQVKELAQEIKKKLKVSVVAGNIATRQGVESYQKHGIDAVRIGIGPGGMCTTRLIAGTGVPQLAAIFDTSSVGIPIIADGGIVYPGDVAKAIAAGAQVVMMGSLFAGTDETPGMVDSDGFKTVRGQASLDYMRDNNVTDHKRTAEGISAKVKVKGKVERIIAQIEGGLRSAMSYTGARTIQEFQEKAIFCIASHATQKESQPHIGQME